MKVDYIELANRFEEHFIEEQFVVNRKGLRQVTIMMPELDIWFKYRVEYYLNITKIKKELFKELKERGWDVQSGLITKSI